MSASCSMLLWTAMPFAMKLCVPRTVASYTSSTPSQSTDTITVAFQGHYSRFTNMATNF